MKLFEKLPHHIISNGKKIRVNLDFRNVLKMMEIMARDDLMPEAREYLALKCICRHPRKGMMRDARRLLFSDAPADPHERIMDFEQDAELIIAAFRQVYGINLYKDKLHWFEFSCLLSCMPDGSKYSEILGIRARPIPAATKYNQAERDWLIKAKAKYALNFSDKEAEMNYQKGIHEITAGMMEMLRGDENHG